VEFGALWGGQPAEQVRVLEDDERIGFLMDGERTLSVAVHEPFDIDPAAIPAIWGEPRFAVPALGPEELGLGEILLLVQARYAPDEPTNDALHLHTALGAQDENPQLGLSMFKLAIEAGALAAGTTSAATARPIRYIATLRPVSPARWAACSRIGAT
jgi:hypothetical protein